MSYKKYLTDVKMINLGDQIYEKTKTNSVNRNTAHK